MAGKQENKKTRPVTIRAVPVVVWKEVKVALAITGQTASEFVVAAIESRLADTRAAIKKEARQ